MPSTHRTTASDVGIQTTRFPQLAEQMRRLTKDGADPTDPAYWHPNALMAASDMLNLGKASQVGGDAALIVLAMLTKETSGKAGTPLDVELHHADGSVAHLSVRFGAALPARVPGTEQVSTAQERLWVEKASIAPEDVHALVQKFAKAQGEAPGSFGSVIGAGAVLALVQAVEATNAAAYTLDTQGFGDDVARQDASLRLTLQGPTPRLRPKMSP